MKRRPALLRAGVCALVVSAGAAVLVLDRGPQGVAARSPGWRDLGVAQMLAGREYVVAALDGGLVAVTTDARHATFRFAHGLWSIAPPAPFAGVELVPGRDRVALVPSDGAVLAIYGEAGGWRTTAAGPVSLGPISAAAWVRDDLVVIGGSGAARYDVEDERWSLLPPVRGIAQPIAIAAPGRDVVAAVWTGNTGSPRTALRVLRPGARRWQSLEQPNPGGFLTDVVAAAGGVAASWTAAGELGVAFGRTLWERSATTPVRGGSASLLGISGTQVFVWAGGGLAYDRRTRAWSELPPLPVRATRTTPVWTGDGLVVLAETGPGAPPRVFSLSLGP